MSVPILLTKLFIPENRPELVSRSHLVDQLNNGLHRKLSLISAPAGFGKTTFVTDWIQSQGDDMSSPFLVGWLSLDENDNDLVRFLTYLVSALNRIPGLETEIGAGALQMLQAPQPLPPESILINVINELTLSALKIVLILDDYHLIDSQTVHDCLNFLIENLPPQLHLVITTREDPPLQISRLRTRDQLNEFRAVHLRFSTSETDEFLNQIMGLRLSTQDIAALEKRTEGWVAGLQLAAISMQRRTDISNFIQSFTGSHHFVIDYLVEEVLKHQPEPIREFLLKTSILDRLTGTLCDAITGQENGQAVLEALERANLFIIPLDDERRWYRYHHLFADLLKQRLKLTFPEVINELHGRAVVWYESNGFLSEAIQHAFAGDDTPTAVRLIEKGALNALERSDFGFLFNSVKRIDTSVLESSPWLFVYYCWALALTGQTFIVALKLEDTDWLLDSLLGDENQNLKMRGYIAGLKMILLSWRRDYKQLDHYFDQVKTYLPENHWIRAYCIQVPGIRDWNSGNLSAAIDSFKSAVRMGKTIENRRIVVTSAGYLGYVLELKGGLREALEVYQDGLRFSQQNGSELTVACYLRIDYARILCELNDLSLAQEHIFNGIKQSQLLSDKRAENLGHSLATRIYLACGNVEMAVSSVRNSEKFVPSPDIVYDMRGGEFPNIRLWLKQNKLQEIESWLKNNNLSLDSLIDFKARMTYTMHARVMISLARGLPKGETYLSQAQDLLATLLDMARSNSWGGKVIEIRALQALAYDLAGEKESAITALEQAILLAEPEGFIRIFVDEGPPMARLLYVALEKGIAPEYVRKLLDAFPAAEPEREIVHLPSASDTVWIEPLSDRELEVLQLIAEGLSRQEIASRLVLSLNTVKTHTRNIYSKLGVNNQMQAVGKARGLGLLDKD